MKRAPLAIIALLLALGQAAAQQNFPTPTGAVTSVTGTGTGSTGAVTATLTAVAGKTTYICGFAVSELNTAVANSYSATISGLLGGSFVYEGQNAASAASTVSQTFTPCVPASAPNTNIVVTTSANADGAAVNAAAWGFNQ